MRRPCGAQYPACYSYDDYGRMRTMTTFRTEDLAEVPKCMVVFKRFASFLLFSYSYF